MGSVDRDWVGEPQGSGGAFTWDQATVAVLQDIRRELKEINHQNWRLLNIFECKNFLNVPKTLRTIARNTARHRCKSCPATAETMRGLRQHGRIRSHAVE